MKAKLTPIQELAYTAKGYATDDQCESALAREKELTHALLQSYEAMLQMRAMLQKKDISILGGRCEAAIRIAAETIFPTK